MQDFTWCDDLHLFLTFIRLIKRSAVVARLFYHTAMCLLSKVHPTESEFSEEMVTMQQNHAHDMCGIVAHVKDR
jgi:hypothetical protein